MGYVHRHDFLEIASRPAVGVAVIDYVDQINVDGLWKLTIFLNSRAKTWLFIEGFDSAAFMDPLTLVGASNATVIPIGGATCNGVPVIMRGIIRYRVRGVGSFVIIREWIENESA